MGRLRTKSAASGARFSHGNRSDPTEFCCPPQGHKWGPHKSVRAVARLSVDVPEPLMRQLKIHAAQGGTTIQRIVLRLLKEELLR